MRRVHVRAVFVALVLAVCAAGTSGEEVVDAVDVWSRDMTAVAVPKVSGRRMLQATTPTPQQGDPGYSGASDPYTPVAGAGGGTSAQEEQLQQLQQQNQKEMSDLSELRTEDRDAQAQAEADRTVAEGVKAAQAKADATTAELDATRAHISDLQQRMDTAAKPDVISQEISDSEASHATRMKELNVKLEAAVGSAAAAGARNAIKSAQDDIKAAKDNVVKLQGELNELMKCTACPGHPDKISTATQQLALAKEAVTTAESNLDTVQVMSQESVERAAQSRVKLFSDQMAAAKKKLQELEKKAIADLKAEGGMGAGTDPTDLTNSKDDAIATAAVTGQLTAASNSEGAAQTKVDNANENLQKVVQKFTGQAETQAADEAVDAAREEGDSEVSAASATLLADRQAVEVAQQQTDTEAQTFKGDALTAAATGNLPALAKTAGQVTTAVGKLDVVEQKEAAEEGTVKELDEKSNAAQLAAKAQADAAADEMMKKAKKLAEDNTIPELEAMRFRHQGEKTKAWNEFASFKAQLITDITEKSNVVSAAANTTSEIETIARKAISDAKLTEFNDAQGSAAPATVTNLEDQLKAANAATKTAQDKAAAVYTKVEAIKDEACKAGADVLAEAQKILAAVTQEQADVSTLINEKVALKISEGEVTRLGVLVTTLTGAHTDTTDLAAQAKKAHEEMKKAEENKKLVEFAIDLRPAQSAVETAQGDLTSAQNEVKAVEVIKKDVDQRAAKDVSDAWVKSESATNTGPTVDEMKDQVKTLETQIQAKERATEQKNNVVDEVTKATTAEEKAMAEAAALQTQIEQVESNLESHPKDPTDGSESPERLELLEKLSQLNAEKLTADAKVDAAKDTASTSNPYTKEIEGLNEVIASEKQESQRLQGEKADQVSKLQTLTTSVNNPDVPLEPAQEANVQKQITTMTETITATNAALMNAQAKTDATIKQRNDLVETQNEVNDSVEQAKSEAQDNSNSFVKENLLYAMKEKAEKTVGIEADEKKLAELKVANEEKGTKQEGVVKTKAVEAAEKKEAEDELMEKQNAVYAEKKTKLDEGTAKTKATNDEKTAKKEVKDKTEAKEAAEAHAKETEKNISEAKEKSALEGEQAVASKVIANEKNIKVAEENNQKMQQKAETAHADHLEQNKASDAIYKQKVMDIDADIKKLEGTWRHDAAVTARAGKINLALDSEKQTKATYKEFDEKAIAKAADAAAEVAKGKEIQGKTKAEEAQAKSKVAEEQDEQAKKMFELQNNLALAAQEKAAAFAKEDENKVLLADLKVTEAKRLSDFKKAKEDNDKASQELADITHKFTVNAAAYRKYAKAKAAKIQEIANQQLADARTDLNADQSALQKAGELVSQTVRDQLDSSVEKSQKLVDAKQTIVDRDGNAVEEEGQVQTRAAEDELAVKNNFENAEVADDKAQSTKEKSGKSAADFTKLSEEMEAKKVAAANKAEELTKAATAAKAAVEGATGEKDYKDAVNKQKLADNQAREGDLKKQQTQRISISKGTEAESSAKEGQVKVSKSSELATKSSVKLVQEQHAMDQEMQAKSDNRKRRATEDFLKRSTESSAMVGTCKKLEQKAVLAIANAEVPADAQAKEADQKAQCTTVNNAHEQLEKDGQKEVKRKADDNTQWTLMKEKYGKHIASLAKFDTAKNAELDAEKVEKAANTDAVEAAAKAGLAREKDAKAREADPEAKPEPPAAPTPAPQAPEQPVAIEAAEEKPDAAVEAAGSYKSPYDELTVKLADQLIPSIASRRRQPIKLSDGSTMETLTEEAKEAAQNTVRDAAAADPGFSEHVWPEVMGLVSVGDAIKQIEKRTAAAQLTVASINFAHSDEPWPGLQKKNSYVARFRGHLNIPSDDKYTFYVDSDDGAILYVDGNEVVNNDGIHDGMVSKSASVALKTGEVPIVVDYFCGDSGKCGLSVDWAGGGRAKGPLDSRNVVEMRPFSKEEENLLQVGESEVQLLE
jgi:hypothetical protein